MDDERKILLKNVYRSAFDYEHEYGGCTQSLLRSIQDHFGSIPDEVIKAAHSLAGGGALACVGTCGSLNGGFLAIGHFFGRPKEGFGREREFKASYKLSMKLYNRFVEEYGSPLCPDVQKKILGRSFDLRTREGNIEFDSSRRP